MAIKFLLVMLGGGLGSAARWWVALPMLRSGATAFPYGTLSVNLAGSALIGLLAALYLRSPEQAPWLLLGVGFCGGFTTFSAFSLELLNMLARGAEGQAALYLGVSVIGGVVLAAGGLFLGRAL